jgi:hypothetical protein
MIDAYAHTGIPRFGTPSQTARFLSDHGVTKFVQVLFPASPDLRAIDQAHESFGTSVRVVGIPLGRDSSELLSIVDAQIRAGVMGFRLTPDDVVDHPRMLDAIGDAGRVIYATSPAHSEIAMNTIHDFLDRYPESLVVSPHFLSPINPEDSFGPSHERSLRRMLKHEHFLPLFSRHGQMGSRHPYPHEDLRPWVEYVLAQASPGRILWGSEYPVFIWRNELLEECVNWLHALLPDRFEGAEGEAFGRDYLGGNAERMLFERPIPDRSPMIVPDWVTERFDPTGQVPLFPFGLQVPMIDYLPMLDEYLARDHAGAHERFDAFTRDAILRGIGEVQ